ncbi:unnamed protein product [Macrosiphum euphorbiae]|uniref:Uncharacterized protein n=1 Tax=Macrosiphum euphorbiae TaxID=13131 RepID=A0AAV0WP19_9HEMI|nr:unnamed protein product [Macrosiphum euphorbiae]
MDKIYSILENSEECQFSIENVILSCIDYEYVPDVKTIRAKWLEKYGENMDISSTNKKTTTVSFRFTSQNILTKHWYENRKVNKEEERQRIVEAAAIIIREDIRSQINDTSSYLITQ